MTARHLALFIAALGLVGAPGCCRFAERWCDRPNSYGGGYGNGCYQPPQNCCNPCCNYGSATNLPPNSVPLDGRR